MTRRTMSTVRRPSEDANPATRLLTRRALLHRGSLLLAGGAAAALTTDQLRAAFVDARPTLQQGLVTDVHYADRPSAGGRGVVCSGLSTGIG